MTDGTAALFPARTKIVATVGPASQSPQMLSALVECGVDVFRLNMAHGSRSDHDRTVADIRKVGAASSHPVGLLVDLAGPKIRLGKLHIDPMECTEGDLLRIVRGHKASAADELVSNYETLIDELSVTDRVMLADGSVSTTVIEKTADTATCRIDAGGLIRSRQGINLPGVNLSVTGLTDADRSNADWAAKVGADFVSLSFVRTAAEIQALSEILRRCGSDALAIAKIEKREALERLDEIVLASDGIMVARGDLGVEIDVAETPVAQKRIIAMCHDLSKPVIVATQMLESMHHSKRPTRAEASDVANAILDGADACMLSGETAVGEYPRESVQVMNRIMIATERMLHQRTPVSGAGPVAADVHPVTAAIVAGASQIATQLLAKLVVISSRSGVTARVYAKQQCLTPSIGVSNSEAALRQMNLFWGITPLAGAPVEDPLRLRQFIRDWGREKGLLTPGDRVVFVTGTGVLEGVHNVVDVQEVE